MGFQQSKDVMHLYSWNKTSRDYLLRLFASVLRSYVSLCSFGTFIMKIINGSNTKLKIYPTRICLSWCYNLLNTYLSTFSNLSTTICLFNLLLCDVCDLKYCNTENLFSIVIILLRLWTWCCKISAVIVRVVCSTFSVQFHVVCNGTRIISLLNIAQLFFLKSYFVTIRSDIWKFYSVVVIVSACQISLPTYTLMNVLQW